MANILHFDIKTNSLASAAPYLCAWVASLAVPVFVDAVLAREVLSRTTVRKMANSVATFVPAAALIGVAFAGCHVPVIMGLLCLAVGCNGAIYSGEQSCMLDIAPNFAGTVMGVANGIGNIMGFVAPQVSNSKLTRV